MHCCKLGFFVHLSFVLGDACPGAHSHIKQSSVLCNLVSYCIYSWFCLVHHNHVFKVRVLVMWWRRPVCLSVCHRRRFGVLTLFQAVSKIILFMRFYFGERRQSQLQTNCGRRVLNFFFSQAYGVNYRRRGRSRVNVVFVGGGERNR